MPQLARLVSDHATLIDIAEALLGIVSRPTPQPAAALTKLELLSATLDDHLAVEKEMIDAAGESGKKMFLPLAAQKGDAFCTLVSDWVDYLGTWPEERVQSDWRGFVHDTLAIVRRLITQIQSENEAVLMVARAQT